MNRLIGYADCWIMPHIAIVVNIGTVFSHPNAWFMRATETVSHSPATVLICKLEFVIFKEVPPFGMVN
jgi:hypothetical protein